MNKDFAMAACATAALALAGCMSNPPKPTEPADIKAHVQTVFSPIIPSTDDELTDGTAQQILMHNCVGYRLGYWNTPGMAEACDFRPATP